MEKEMFEFLDKITPSYGGCVLIELMNESENSMNHYMVVVRIAISNGDMFLLNGRFFYDYVHMFEPDKWKIVYQRMV